MRRAAPLLVAAFLLPFLALAPVPAGGAASASLMHAPCADAQPATLVAQWDAALENLAFDGAGALYLSDLGGDRLLRVTPGGAVTVVASVPGMHGLVFGPDGLLYVGATPPGADGAQVWRFTSLSPPAHDVVATGLRAANGMAFDLDGNLFVSSPLSAEGPYLVRLPAHDPAAWTAWGDEYGPNGLALDATGAWLYSVTTGDQSSPVLRISTSDPTVWEQVGETSFGVGTLQPGVHAPSGPGYLVPKGLDDLAFGPDGQLYAAAHVTGELLRVDPTTGAACAYASGFEEPTSVRVAQGFGAYDGWLFVTDMGGAAVTGFTIGGAGALWAVPPP